MSPREKIIEAALTVLREQGYAGFTQPRVAKLAGIRQSNLTYYFPTRLDLLAAVGRASVERQLAAMDALFSGSTPRAVAESIARVVMRPENTRVFMALAAAADQEPLLRDIFRELTDGIVIRAGNLFEGLKRKPVPNGIPLLHALSVGLAVINLATGLPGGDRRATEVLATALDMVSKARA